jgi:hypothetical protein
MNTRNASDWSFQSLRASLLALAVGGGLWTVGPLASAADFTVNPLDGAADVSVSTPVVFTFAVAMDTSTTMFIFNAGGIPSDAEANWNTAATVATITPAPTWPASATIQWTLYGFTVDDDFIPGQGSFSTGGSSSGGGTGTNAVTSFSVGVYHRYLQTNSAMPALDPEISYFFNAGTVLASNRTANAVTMQPPGQPVLSLSRSPTALESFYFFDYATNDLPTFNTKYPGGAYQFTVTAASSNQQINVNLPNSTLQPNAPHVTNYVAAQAVNPAQAFTLSWDPFVGGTARDFIWVEVGEDFTSPEPPQPNVLNGTATSVVIPANTLRSNFNYTATIYFARLNSASNSTESVTNSARVTTTEFSLKTSSPATLLTNSAAILTNQFRFQVRSDAGQTLFVESSETLLSNSWTTAWTTNAPGSLTTIVLPMVTPPSRRFFRVRTN